MKGKAPSTDPDSPRSIVLGTAGHIDHGKTALVLALTGTDTDRLPEEKTRGITIDLGFAALALIGPDGQRFDASLVDVPGHHAFLRNMLAGTGGIDAVMLVVAADEGVKAQTMEHLQICTLLGIRHGLVVLSKVETVTRERINAAREEILRLVAGTFLERAPVVEVSALRHIGIGDLKAELGRLAASVPERGTERVARLPIDRVFSVKGFGTVVTGTLLQGTLRTGTSVLLEPAGRELRVRGLQVHNKAQAEATAPNRVALNLAGIEVSEVKRGDTVVPLGFLQTTTVVDVALHLLPERVVRHRQRVRVHAFAAECVATLLLYPQTEGEPQLARLRLNHPLLLLPGDPLVLRQPSPALTLGGAKVLDATPQPRLSKARVKEWLLTLLTSSIGEQMFLRVRRRGVRGITGRQLGAEVGWTREALDLRLRPQIARGELQQAGLDLLLPREEVDAVKQGVLRELARTRSQQTTRAELRRRLEIPEDVSALAFAQLVTEGKVRLAGEQVVDAQSETASTLSTSALRVDTLYRKAGLACPLVNDAAQQLSIPIAEMRSAVTSLLRAGSLVRLGSDALLVHKEALDRLKQQLSAFRGERIDVPRFKELTGLTRKHAIPLLEYLDGARVTRNSGGVRSVV